MKTRVCFIFTLLIISAFALSPTGPNSTRAQSFTPHDPIFISGDSDFTLANGVLPGGDGTQSNPHVIAGWDINKVNNATTGPLPGSAIHIRNTHHYFIIRDNYIHTPPPSSPSSETSGVYLENAPNGVVENVQVIGPYYGISVSTSPSSIIENNNVWNTTVGVNLSSGSSYSKATSNTVHNSTQTGMWITGVDNTIITNNNVTCNNATCTGYLLTITRSLFEGNVVQGNCQIAIETCYGYRILSSTDNSFLNNTLQGTAFGFILNGGDDRNIVKGNRASGNQYGIGLEGAEYSNGTISQSNTGNTVSENILINNAYGIYAFASVQNKIFDNYLNNTNNAYADTAQNSWNTTETVGRNILGGPFLGGNFYSNYAGTDSDGDGIGDTPYRGITGNLSNIDPLPLVLSQPTVFHDIAITGLTVQPSSGLTGTTFTITISLRNRGSLGQYFTVNAYYNQTLIGTRTVTNLQAQTSTTITLTWDTSTVAPGNYSIMAKVPPVTGETNIGNNNSPEIIVRLNLDEPPVAAFTSSTNSTSVRSSVIFNASPSYDPDGNIVHYSWNFGDNTALATGAVQTHYYSLAGSYRLILTVTDDRGTTANSTRIITVTALPPTPPLALRVGYANGNITITWNPPSDDGGALITGYKIYRGVNPTNLHPYQNVPGSATSYSDAQVSNGQVYYYSVTAVNSGGESPSSDQQSLTVPLPNPPSTSQDSTVLTASIIAAVIILIGVLTLFQRRRSRKRTL